MKSAKLSKAKSVFFESYSMPNMLGAVKSLEDLRSRDRLDMVIFDLESNFSDYIRTHAGEFASMSPEHAGHGIIVLRYSLAKPLPISFLEKESVSRDLSEAREKMKCARASYPAFVIKRSNKEFYAPYIAMED